jgi:hypothetical protein
MARRLLVAAGGDGVRLWNAATAQEITHLPIGRHEAVVFHPRGDRFFTYGRTGLRSWPIHTSADGGPARLQVGPPQIMDVRAGRGEYRACCGGNGARLAVSDNGQVVVLDLEPPAKKVALPHRDEVNSLAISPDGCWLATGNAGLRDRGIRIWDAESGKQVRQLAVPNARVAFSPDGKWLIAGGVSDYRLWKVGSWEEDSVLDADRRQPWDRPLAFTRDSRVLAMVRYGQQVQLYDLAERKEVAVLTVPDAPRIVWLCFSPDGSQLAAATEAHTIGLWDFRALRQELQKLELDRDLPACPPAPQSPETGLAATVFPDVLEAENLPVVAVHGCQYEVQDMTRFDPDLKKWPSGRQVLCSSGSEGSYVELEVNLPRRGCYRLDVWFTKSVYHGLVQVSVDGQKVGRVFDSFHKGVEPSGRIDCGVTELEAGSHRLRFTAVGKNPQAKGHCMGIDCLQFTPVDEASRSVPGAGQGGAGPADKQGP